MSVGPLGDLGALGVMRSVQVPRSDSHAKRAEGAKDCIDENSGFPELRYFPALLGALGALGVVHVPSSTAVNAARG